MNKTILFLAMLGLVSKSQITFAQTHYTGIASVHLVQSSSPPECGYGGICDSICNIRYTVYPPPNNINYSIEYDIPVANVGVNVGTISDLFFRGDSTQISYLKNDADSIVFPFVFHIDHTLHGSIGDGCHAYEQYWDYTGVARISTTTAGVTTNKNDAFNLELLPNPTTGLLRIKTTANKAIVIDCVGRVVISQKIEAYDNLGFSMMNVSSLPSGCYTLLLDEGMKKITAKFIKY